MLIHKLEIFESTTQWSSDLGILQHCLVSSSARDGCEFVESQPSTDKFVAVVASNSSLLVPNSSIFLRLKVDAVCNGPTFSNLSFAYSDDMCFHYV